MRLKFRMIFIMGFILFIFIFNLVVFGENNSLNLISSKDFGDGLYFKKYSHKLSGEFYVITLDSSSKNWGIKPTTSNSGINSTDTITKHSNDNNAICTINASYFDTKTYYPVGPVVKDGEIAILDNEEWPTLCINNEGKFLMKYAKIRAYIKSGKYEQRVYIWQFNHPVSENATDIVAGFNKYFGKSVNVPQDSQAVMIRNNKVVRIDGPGITEIPNDGIIIILKGGSLDDYLRRFEVGKEIEICIDSGYVPNVISAVSGGPWLVTNSQKMDLDMQARDFVKKYSKRVFKSCRRTIIGITDGGELFLAVFPKSISLGNVATVLVDMHAKEAICLDSGASTGLWLDGKEITKGSGRIPVALTITRKN